MRKIKMIYWTCTTIFAILMVMDGIAGISKQPEGQEAFRQLGYPIYLMSIIGAAKILGAVALMQNKYKVLKEWAFAGFVFNFIGASLSWFFSNGQTLFVLIPLFMLLFLFLLYYLWKKLPA